MSELQYAPKPVKTAKQTLLFPADLDIPTPTMSTREYYHGKRPEEIDTQNIPPNIGLQAVDGTILSIHQIERYRQEGKTVELLNWLADPNKPFSPIPTQGDIASAGITFFNQDGAPFTIGISGNRNGGVTSLRFKVDTIYTTKITEDIKISADGNILRRGTSLTGTVIETYAQYITLSKITPLLDKILFEPKSQKWLLLPNGTLLSDSKLLSALKGAEATTGFIQKLQNKDDNKAMEQAFLVWLSTKVYHITDTHYLPTFDMQSRNSQVAHSGSGVVNIVVPKKLPNRLAKPDNYSPELDRLVRERAPIEAMVNIALLKGFHISHKHAKQSIVIISVPSNWGKSLIIKKAFINTGLGVDQNFLNTVKTISQDGGKGSESLTNIHHYGIVFYDEMDKALGQAVLKDPKAKSNIVNTIKEIAVGVVSGDSKNESNVKTFFPASVLMAKDTIDAVLRGLSANAELDNRTLYPALPLELAPDYFKDFTEDDTVAHLEYAISDIFYKGYDYLLTASREDRVKWCDNNIYIDEGDFDRVVTRATNETMHLALLFQGVARLFTTDTVDERFAEEFTEVRDGIAIRKPFRADHGFYYLSNDVLNDQTEEVIQAIKEAKNRDLYNTVCKTNKNSTYYVDKVAVNGHSISCSMMLPLDFDIIKLPIEEIKAMIKNFKDEVESLDFVPLLQVFNQGKLHQSKKWNAVMVRLYMWKMEQDGIEPEVIEDEEDDYGL